MGQHLLVVGALRRFHQELYQLCPTVETTVLCCERVSGLVDERTRHRRLIILHNNTETAEWIQIATLLHQRDTFTGIVSLSDAEQRKAAAIAAHLGLPMHATQTIEAVHDKSVMRERLAHHGVDATRFLLASSAAELRNAAEEVGFPLVVKPVAGVGSRGVTVVRTPLDIDPALRWAEISGTPQPFLVEQLHEGREFSVETLTDNRVHHVLAVTRKFTDDTHRVERGHVVPAELDSAVQKQMTGYVVRVLETLGVQHGVSHTEIIFTAEGPRLIETHLRPAGDRLPDLVAAALDLDMVKLLAAQVLGHPTELPTSYTGRHAAIWFGSPQGPGVLRAIHGVPEARRLPHVTEVEELMAIGTEVPAVASSAGRGVFVKAVASDEHTATRAARTATERITFAVE